LCRIHLDTNIQVKKMKDDKLGAFEFLFYYDLIIICLIHAADKIRQWLAAPDSSRNQNEARDKRQVDTCAWFIEGERFRVWKETPGFLWIKGKRKFFCSSMLNFACSNIYSGMR
jgi:hypothetical protein